MEQRDDAIIIRIDNLERKCELLEDEARRMNTEISNIKIAAGRTDEQYINIMKTLDTLIIKVDKITSRPLKYIEYFVCAVIGCIVAFIFSQF